MPFKDETEYRKYASLVSLWTNALNSHAEQPNASPDDDTFQLYKGLIDKFGPQVDEYERENRVTDATGKLKKPPKTRIPAVVEPVLKDGGFYYEPTVNEARVALQDPKVRLEANVGDEWLNPAPYGDPELADQLQLPEAMGPMPSHLDTMGPESSAYKSYQEYAWKKASEEAKLKGLGLKRYKDVELGDDPVDYLTGGVGYNIEKRLAPALLGAADSATFGLASPAGDALTKVIEKQLADRGITIPEQPTAQDVINRSPGSYTVGSVLGYAHPAAPINMAARGAQSVVNAVGINAAETPVRSALASAATGAALNAGEGAVRRAGQAAFQGQDAEGMLQAAGEGLGTDAAFGAGAAALGEGVSQAAGAGARAIDRRIPELKNLRDAGGDTRVGLNVTAPERVQEYVRLSEQPRAVGSAADRAAQAVAPRLQKSIEDRSLAEQQRIGDQMREYFEHPAYRDITASTAPLVDALVDMVERGRFSAPVSGRTRYVDPNLVRTVAREMHIADAVPMEKRRAQQYAAEHGYRVVDPQTAQDIFGYGGDVPQGYAHVIVPAPFNANQLTQLEQKIDDILKYGADGKPKNDPVYKTLQLAAKQVRDQFPYYVDDAGKLVPPPGYRDPNAPPSGPDMGPAHEAEFVDTPRDPGPGSAIASTPDEPPPPSFDPGGPQLGPGGPPRLPGGGDPELGTSIDRPPPSLGPGTMRSELDDATPLSLLAGNKLAMEREPVRGGDTEPAMRPPPRPDEMPRGGENPVARAVSASKSPVGLVSVADVVKAFGGDVAQAHKALLDLYEAGAIELRPEGGLNRLSPEEVKTSIPGPQGTTLSWFRVIDPKKVESLSPLEKSLDRQLGVDQPFADVSQPAPNAKQWRESTDESAQWYDDIVSPGAPARSSEAKRMADLTEQQNALDAAETQIRQMEDRLGRMEPADRLQSILNIMSKRLGREVTKEDLVRAGLITGGVALAATSDDEDSDVLGAMAIGGGIGGGRGGRRSGRGGSRQPPAGGPSSVMDDLGKRPRQLEAQLDDGETVRGFSALRRQQHLAQNELERAKARMGAGGENTIHRRVIDFNQVKGNGNYDQALLEEARKAGLVNELYEAAGTSVYPDLRNRGALNTNRGLWNGILDLGAIRGQKLLEMLGGMDRNPYLRNPEGFFGQLAQRGFLTPGRELLNLSGGRAGARYGNELEKLWDAILNPEPQNEERENETR